MAIKQKEKICTLCIVHKHPKVLLGFKKRGFGKGRWNGFGGKVEKEESIEEAAKRELKEEAGIVATNLQKAGELYFEFKNSGDKLQVHVFKVSDFFGQEKESVEMKPQWFYIDEIPFKEMWPDDVYWMPLFFSGRSFKGSFIPTSEERRDPPWARSWRPSEVGTKGLIPPDCPKTGSGSSTSGVVRNRA